eukprot:12882037-Prorocentrum_lima.AAC.1
MAPGTHGCVCQNGAAGTCLDQTGRGRGSHPREIGCHLERGAQGPCSGRVRGSDHHPKPRCPAQ